MLFKNVGSLFFMEEEAKDLIVLGAINNGARQFNKISKVTKIKPEELNDILGKLENRGFINVDEKKGWLGKKIELNVTEKGSKEIQERIHELQGKWKNMRNAYESGDKQKLQQIMKDEKSFLPTMMFFGIIDIMMFSMMFSMMGMAMSSYIPAEDMSQFNDGDGLGDSGMDDGGFDMDIGF
jgi:DNA-binding HxlR family transcriptional regulator